MKGALIIAAALAMAGPVLAQDTAAEDGWDVLTQEDEHIAGVSFSSGIALMFRCGPNPGGTKYFQAFVTGLPAAEGRRRVLEIARPGGQFETQMWTVATSSTAALSPDSARLARGVRLGGAFAIRVPADGQQPAREFRMELPSDPAGIDAALTACGASLVDEADAVQPAHTIPGNGVYWRSHPTPRYPDRALARGIKAGRVEISCAVTADGRTQDCEIVSEDPPQAGFGREALAAARQATLEPREPDAPDRGRITFPITFRIQ